MSTTVFTSLVYALTNGLGIDENTTLGLIGLLLYASDMKTGLSVALEQKSGPFPKWSIPKEFDSKIDPGLKKIYVADITEAFTLALVRDVDEDFPLPIREFFHSNLGLVSHFPQH
jgi:hypothetical protein